MTSGAIGSRVAGLLVVLASACAPVPAPDPVPPFASVAQGARYLGCWRLTTDAPASAVRLLEGRTQVVRLDSLIRLHRDTVRVLEGRGLVGFPRTDDPGFLVHWWLSSGGDTLHLKAGVLSGPAWRLGWAGDSLVGRVAMVWDRGPRTEVLGTAVGHRVACTSIAERAP